MIKMKINLNFDGLEKEVKEFEQRTVRVGVLNPSENTRTPILKKTASGAPPTKSIKEASGKRALRVKGQNKNLKMTALGKILDAKYGVFSDDELRFEQRDLNDVIEFLGDTFGKPVTSNQKRRIENACIALVRNPIMNRKFTSNSRDWEKRKGFNWPLVSTGYFLMSIEAQMNV